MLILAQHVGNKLNAELSVIVQFVLVLPGSKEIHLSVVQEFHLHQLYENPLSHSKRSILVHHHLVVQILNVELLAQHQLALASQVISVPHQTADLNVFPTTNVPVFTHVYKISVEIHVEALVDLMRSARSKGMSRFVLAFQDMKGILLEAVVELL